MLENEEKKTNTTHNLYESFIGYSPVVLSGLILN